MDEMGKKRLRKNHLLPVLILLMIGSLGLAAAMMVLLPEKAASGIVPSREILEMKYFHDLSATGLGIDSNYDLPGDVRFYNMIYQKTGGSAASVSLTGYVDPGTSPRFSGLSAVVEQNPSQVKLWTPN